MDKDKDKDMNKDMDLMMGMGVGKEDGGDGDGSSSNRDPPPIYTPFPAEQVPDTVDESMQPLLSNQMDLVISPQQPRHSSSAQLISPSVTTTSNSLLQPIHANVYGIVHPETLPTFNQNTAEDNVCEIACLPSSWLAIVFIPFIDFPFALFTFIYAWISITLVVASLVLPFLTLLIFPLFAYSWRALAKCELAMQSYFVSSSSPSNNHVTIIDFTSTGQVALMRDGIESLFFPPPLIPFTAQPGFMGKLRALFWDKYTWKSLLYFMLIKLPVSFFTFVIVTTLTSCTLPVLLFCFPCIIFVGVKVARFQKRVAYTMLGVPVEEIEGTVRI